MDDDPLAGAVGLTRLLVCGSRGWTDREKIVDTLEHYQPTVVIHGGASGADDLVHKIATANGIHCAEVAALWNHGGRSAGPRRNQAMLALCPDLVVAFWDGESRGTADMIRRAGQAGVSVEVIR